MPKRKREGWSIWTWLTGALGVFAVGANGKVIFDNGTNTCSGVCPQGREQFCQPFYYRSGGWCEECWKCCAFRAGETVFDLSCREACECGEEGVSLCRGSGDCGAGMFCDGEEGVCRSCVSCSDELQCSAACGGFENAMGDRVLRAHAYYKHMLGEADNGVEVGKLLECPGLGRESPFTTFEECPCAAFNGALKLNCPLETTCVRGVGSMFLREYDVVIAGSDAVIDTMCKRCELGRLCDRVGMIGEAPLCPEGFYCPTPREALPCPAGAFCPEGSVAPRTCDYVGLAFSGEPVGEPATQPLERLLFKQDPFRGNYCPMNVTIPNRVCEAGYYCPDVATRVRCPKGYYCRQQSVAPQKCPRLAVCDREGLGEPRYSWAVVIFFVVMLFVLIGGRVLGKRFAVEAKNKKTVIAKYSGMIRPVRELRFEGLTARDGIKDKGHPWLWSNSGEFQVCRLNAVMGSSGCGKSTLIEMIRGRVVEGVIGGRVKVVDGLGETREFGAGDGGGKDVAAVRRLIGFVPQDDVLLGELTVRENLEYSARLKFAMFEGRRMALCDIVDGVCDALGFDAKIQGRIVGTVDKRGISGGQRKRVNIGMELVGLHPVIFMDEPTSGLDSTMSEGLLRFCKELTGMGSTIVCVVHQPRCSSFLLFDRVLLLSRFGATFCGSPYEAIAYYERALLGQLNIDDNPADAIMDLLTYGIKQEVCAVLDQREQAVIWENGRGGEWLTALRNEYPGFDQILSRTIGYDDIVERRIGQILGGIAGEMSAAKVIRFFDAIGVRGVRIGQAREFLALNLISDAYDFKRAVRNICNAYERNGAFDNAILKLELLGRLPGPLVDAHSRIETDEALTGMRKLRVMTKVATFGYRLMERIGIEPVGTGKSSFILAHEVLLAVLIMKNGVDEDGFREPEMVRLWGVTSTDTLDKVRSAGVLSERKLLSVSRSPWFIQLLIPAGAALIVGLIHGGAGVPNAFAGNIVMACACVGVLSMVTHVRTFSLDKVFIRREVYNNISLLSYFVAYNLVDLVWIFMIPLTFFVPYYNLTFPLTEFVWFYVAGLMVCWWASGMAYVLSASPFALHWANLIGVFIAVIYGAFINGLNPSMAGASWIVDVLLGGSYNRWVMESLTLRELSTREQVMPNVVFAISKKLGLCDLDRYDFDDLKDIGVLMKLLRMIGVGRERGISVLDECGEYITRGFAVLFAQGVAWRILAFVMMWSTYDSFVGRKKYLAKLWLVRKFTVFVQGAQLRLGLQRQ